jgi:dienelactone hydrolase
MKATRVALGWVVALGTACAACSSSAGGDGTGSPDGGGSTANDASGAPEASSPSDGGSGGNTMDAPQGRSDAGGHPTGDASAPPSGDGGTGYGNDGPVSYTMASLPVTSSLDSFTVNVWVPKSAGPHPVVSFSPGLVQPSAGYVVYATRLASWGFVVLMRDDPGLSVSGDTVASDISYTVATWLAAQNTTSGSPLFGKADLSHVGLAGHSRGGQATLDAAEAGLHGKVEAWVGLDPVNTAYSAGTAPSTNLPSIGTPTLYLGAGVATNCAPAGDNYQTLYAVSPSPSIAITVANASHSQFENVGGSLGGLICSPLGTANTQKVIDIAMKYMTAFFAMELLGDSSVGPQFQGTGVAADEAAGLITLVSK